MIRKTLYRKKSRIWDAKIREIVRYFSLDFTSDITANLTWLNPKTTQDWYRYIRKAISVLCEAEKAEIWTGSIEIDESYFWPTRVRWKRWRWAGMKTIVFGLLKRNGKVYTEIVPDVKAKTLVPIIRWKVKIEDIEINSDGWPAYDGLVDIGYEKHYRVHHGANVPQAYTSLNSLDETNTLTELNHSGALKKEDSLNSIELRKPIFITFWKNLNFAIIAVFNEKISTKKS